jgi:predicted pyridoxine 5'-phosphate oxidase superfamily flavin-nucleotide-binding protein
MVHFLSDAQQLESMLPPGFELAGEPVVTVSLTYMTESAGWPVAAMPCSG